MLKILNFAFASPGALLLTEYRFTEHSPCLPLPHKSSNKEPGRGTALGTEAFLWRDPCSLSFFFFFWLGGGGFLIKRSIHSMNLVALLSSK